MTTEFPNLMRLLAEESNRVTRVPWPQRSAVGICHDHPECKADAVMAARCRGFSDACVRGVPAPAWEAEKSPEETLIEGVRLLSLTVDEDVRYSNLVVAGVDRETGAVTMRPVPQVQRTAVGEYRVTLPREAP